MRLDQAISDFLAGYFSTHERSKKTRTAYSSDLAQLCAFLGGGFDLLLLSGSVVEQWVAHLRSEKYAPASSRRKVIALKVFCSYWVRKGVLQESPFWRVKLSLGRPEQLPRALSEREMGALLSRARRNHRDAEDALQDGAALPAPVGTSRPSDYRALRDLALVDLLFGTGMRVGEASALDVRDFFAREAAFRVQGKGGRDRLAFAVGEESVRIQRAHLEARLRVKAETEALFINASGGRLSTQGMAHVIARLRRQARIRRHVTPHMLRHTVATLLLRNGADIRVVQEFLGHASIATTQRYTHVTKDHLVRVLRKRHPALAFYAKALRSPKRKIDE